MSDYLIVGLGNPGQQYELTRHNIGWMLIDVLAARWSANLSLRPKEKAWLGSARVAGQKIWLCKPTTYMNLSGEAVQPLLAYYQIPRERMLVLSDDVNLDFGRARLRSKGSSGGQKGIQHLIQRLGGEDFPRLRIGVGPKPQGRDLAGFVLQRFNKEELAAMPEILDQMARGTECWAREGVEAAIPLINAWRLTQI